MKANDVQPDAPIRHGAYVCLSPPAGAAHAVAEAGVPALAERLGLRNEFGAAGGDPPASVAYLRRIGAEPGHIADPEVLAARAVVHVAAPGPEPVAEFCAGLARLFGPAVGLRVLGGVVRPLNYTGRAMFNFAYARRVVQQPGTVMRNAFLAPMRKTAQWWEKAWPERHTYFLPRYDDSGGMRSEGHALAAAPGIDCLLRRTYKNPAEPAPAGEYDFVSYFECADEDVPTFHAVCGALRDTTRNPEWTFVREGPLWHGQRVATWSDLFG